MTTNRTEYVIKNSWYGFANKLITLLLSFFVRTIFIRQLGAEYLGMEGIFSNVLSLLSLAELGIGNVLAFSLYKPISLNDTNKINQLLRYYKKLYRVIAILVALVGISIVPFLSLIVNSSFSDNDVLKFYLIYLLNSVISYIAVCYTTLIKAGQEQYIVNIITSVVKIISSVAQVIVLISFCNFAAYLLILSFSTLFQNIIISQIAKHKYNISNSSADISVLEKKEIFINVKSTFLYKIGVVIVNATDNILISVIVGTIYVGYYSNYTLIVNQVNTLVSVLCTAMISSIGNMATDDNSEKSKAVFERLVFFFHLFSALWSVGFFFIFNDVISIWIGSSNALGVDVVFAISFSFYIQNTINTIWMYREAYGLFNQIKYLMLVTAVINIILSVIGGKLWGITGIVIATGISRCLTTVWYEPRILYKQIFKRSAWEYLKLQGRFLISTLITCIVVWLLFSKLAFDLTVINISFKCCLICIVCLMAFIAPNYKRDECRYWLRFVKKLKIKAD